MKTSFGDLMSSNRGILRGSNCGSFFSQSPLDVFINRRAASDPLGGFRLHHGSYSRSEITPGRALSINGMVRRLLPQMR